MKWPSILLASITVAAVVLGCANRAEAQSAAAGDTPLLRKKPTLPSAAATPSCTWTGHRILMSLLREDIVAANDLFAVYDRFGCSMPWLRQAFDCLTTGAQPDDAPAVSANIAECWSDPAAAKAKTGVAPSSPSAAGK